MLDYLFKRHTILNEQSNARIQIPYIFFKDEIFLGLRRDLGLQFTEISLSCSEKMIIYIIHILREAERENIFIYILYTFGKLI